MKQRYHINFNPITPSSEEINQYKNFDALLKNYAKQQNIQKKTVTSIRLWRLTSIAIAASITGFILWNQLWISPFSESQYLETQANFFNVTPFIDPPLANAQPVFNQYKANALSGGQIKCNDKAILTIPESAFQDQEGNTIKGEIDLFYRSMYEPTDFFLSGVPLVYDSSEIEYLMESIAVIELYAEQNGKKIQIRNGKNIQINWTSELTLESDSMLQEYKTYYLDQKHRTWVYQTNHQVDMLEKEIHLETQLEGLKQEEKLAFQALVTDFPTLKKPEAPIQKRPKVPTFDLEGLAIDKAYKNTIWQLAPDSSPLPKSPEIEGIEIVPLTDNNYQITFTLPNGEVKVIAQKVLTNEAYAIAKAEYENELRDYEKKLTAQDSLINVKRQRIINDFRERQAALLANLESTEKQTTMNTLSITQLGIWSCNRLVPAPTTVILATFKNQQQQYYKNVKGYLIDETLNTIQPFLVAEKTWIKYKADSKNTLVIVTDDKHIAVIRSDDFDALRATTSRSVLEIELLIQAPNTKAEVHKAIKL
jgi:hypothetical protein